LGSKRAGRKLRECEALYIILPRDPPSVLNEVPIHSAGERYGATEAVGPEAKEIGKQLRERTWLL
jgi:hypothetical protein